MNDHEKADFGSVHIHRQVIADIAANAIADVKGLNLAEDNCVAKIQTLFGLRKYPAISVTIDKANQVRVDVRVVAHYGMNISDSAAQAQDLIREAIERAGDIDVKNININIRGMQRGDQ